MNKQTQLGVGIGVYVRKEGKLLLGKRMGGYGAGSWGAPGGKIEMWESPEECAVREVKEETGMEVQNLTFIGIVNDQDKDHGTHYVSISYVADWKEGEPVPEPGKFEEWRWFPWDALPEPKFLPLRNFLASGYNPFTI